MPVELRKRKAPAAPPPPPAKKRADSVKSGGAAEKKGAKAAPNGATAPTKVAVGDVIALESFGGEIETQDGEKTTLKKLIDESKNGVVLFTYPKASTPGCTQQACLFRDSYEPLTSTGLSIYGLSTDSPKANTTFKTKQNLPYTLLCDPNATLIGAIGFKKAPKGTTRGVFVIDKQGKILAAEPGGPEATVEVVRKLIGSENVTGEAAKEADEERKDENKAEENVEVEKPASTEAMDTDKTEEAKEDKEKADVVAEVADTAAKVDA